MLRGAGVAKAWLRAPVSQDPAAVGEMPRGLARLPRAPSLRGCRMGPGRGSQVSLWPRPRPLLRPRWRREEGCAGRQMAGREGAARADG